MARRRKGPDGKRGISFRLTPAGRAKAGRGAVPSGPISGKSGRQRPLDYRSLVGRTVEQRLADLLRVDAELDQVVRRIHRGHEPDQDYLRDLTERIAAVLGDVNDFLDHVGRPKL